MADKQPTQVAGGDKARVADAPGKDKAGESGGGAYPNPHTGKAGRHHQGFMGHGGQTDIAYDGQGQGTGDTDVGDLNATTKSD